MFQRSELGMVLQDTWEASVDRFEFGHVLIGFE